MAILVYILFMSDLYPIFLSAFVPSDTDFSLGSVSLPITDPVFAGE